MLNRHRDELLKRLERVSDLGTCEIRYAELRIWYGRERLTKTVWADILDLWSEIRDNEDELLVGPGEGLITLLYNDGLTASAESWWKDLRSWSGAES
jgi:hypothetical protein